MIIILSAVFFSALFLSALLIIVSNKLEDRKKWKNSLMVNKIVNILTVSNFVIAIVLLALMAAAL